MHNFEVTPRFLQNCALPPHAILKYQPGGKRKPDRLLNKIMDRNGPPRCLGPWKIDDDYEEEEEEEEEEDDDGDDDDNDDKMTVFNSLVFIFCH